MNPDIVLACNLSAFDTVERQRYVELRFKVHAAVLGFHELADGFAF